MRRGRSVLDVVLKSTAAVACFYKLSLVFYSWFSTRGFLTRDRSVASWPLSALVLVSAKVSQKGGRWSSASFLHPTCVCHFSITSYIPRMLALLFPASRCVHADFIAWSRLGGGFWKRKIGFVSKPHKGRCHACEFTPHLTSLKWINVTLVDK